MISTQMFPIERRRNSVNKNKTINPEEHGAGSLAERDPKPDKRSIFFSPSIFFFHHYFAMLSQSRVLLRPSSLSSLKPLLSSLPLQSSIESLIDEPLNDREGGIGLNDKLEDWYIDANEAVGGFKRPSGASAGSSDYFIAKKNAVDPFRVASNDLDVVLDEIKGIVGQGGKRIVEVAGYFFRKDQGKKVSFDALLVQASSTETVREVSKSRFVSFRSLPSHSTQQNTTQHNTTQHNTTQHNAHTMQHRSGQQWYCFCRERCCRPLPPRSLRRSTAWLR